MKITKKFKQIKKAAQMGKPHAMYQLGLHYETGKYVTQNQMTAAWWISMAAEEGYAPAKEWMQDYLFDDDANVQANA